MCIRDRSWTAASSPCDTRTACGPASSRSRTLRPSVPRLRRATRLARWPRRRTAAPSRARTGACAEGRTTSILSACSAMPPWCCCRCSDRCSDRSRAARNGQERQRSGQGTSERRRVLSVRRVGEDRLERPRLRGVLLHDDQDLRPIVVVVPRLAHEARGVLGVEGHVLRTPDLRDVCLLYTS